MKDTSDLGIILLAARRANLHGFANALQGLRGQRDKIVQEKDKREQHELDDDLERIHRIEKGY